MEIWEIFLIGIALSMDAFAVGMANGAVEPKMRTLKILAVAGSFGLFQFIMPVAGYYLSGAFASFVEKIAPYFAFSLLCLLGGRMIFDCGKDRLEQRKERRIRPYLSSLRKPLGAGELFIQSVATSIDALAVGVAMLAAETDAGLPYSAVLCAVVIGAVTFSLSVIAVVFGAKAGKRLGGSAELFGGAVLIAIGVKILLEGII